MRRGPRRDGSNGVFARVLAPLKSPATIEEAEASIELFPHHSLPARPGVDPAAGHPQAPRHRHGGGGFAAVLLLDEPTSGISVEEKFWRDGRRHVGPEEPGN